MKTRLVLFVILVLTLKLKSQSISFSQAAGSPITLSTNYLRGIVSADLNGDGIKDLIAGNSYSNSISVLLGNGSGQFSHAPGSPKTVPTGPIYATISDFNGDMIPDFATANYSNSSISVYLGVGTGSFVAASGSPITIGVNPYCIDSKDFNMDGKIDLVAVAESPDKVYVFLGNGGGSFVAAPGSPYTPGTNPNHVSVGHFNSDAFPDFAVSNGGSNNVSVFLGAGTGSFSPAPGSPFASGTFPRAISLSDFNNDGMTDMAICNGSSNTLRILLGTSTGSFVNAPGSPFNSMGTYPYQAAIADYDLDGLNDLAITNGTSNYVSVFLSLGTGSFTPAVGSPLIYGSTPQSICSDDFNGDGKADLAIGDYVGSNLIILTNSQLSPQGIHPYSTTEPLTIYPNPFSQEISVNFNAVAIGRVVEIIDVKGKTIYSKTISDKENHIDMSAFSDGAYLLKVTNGEKIITEKIIKQSK